MTQEAVSKQVGRSRSAVANALRLLSLPDPVKQLLEEGRLSAGHARAILAAPDKSLQRLLAQRVIDEDLSVRQTEALAKRLAAQAAAGEPEPKPEDPYRIYRDAAAKNLSDRFGRKVSIVQGAKKGKIELEYYDDSDLTSLLDLLEQVRSEPKGGPQP